MSTENSTAGRWQFLVFVGIGVLSALIDIAVLQILILLGVHFGIAVTVGFFTGFLVNYLGHSRVTFQKRESVRSVLGFSFVVFLNYLITLLCVVVSTEVMGDVLVGKIVSLPIVAVHGYLWGKHVVFK